MTTAYASIYRGVVTNAADPEQLGRVKAQVPQVLGSAETAWAWPVSPNIANITALHIGDPVWLAFEGGELEHPVWLGTWPLVGLELDPLPDLTAEAAARQAADITEAAERTAADTAEAVARTAADNAEATARLTADTTETAARIAADNALSVGLTIPPGMLMPYAGPVAPTGWLLCNGAEVSKTTQAGIWAAIGAAHVYGTPVDPVNNFLLPNLKGRTVVMQDAAQTEFATIGLAGGSKTSTAVHSHSLVHTHTMGNHTHALTAHDHSLSDHRHALEDHTHSCGNHNHGGGTGSHAHVCLNNVYLNGNPAHGHDGAGDQSCERPNVTSGFSSPGNITSTVGIGNIFEEPEGSGYHSPAGTHSPVSNLSGAAQDIGTPGTPSTNTSDGASTTTTSDSSVSAVSGNLQPFLTMNYLIKT